MSLEQLVSDYGYLALFIGTFLEGETIMVLSGLAAKRGFLELPWVMLVGGVGSLLGDQFFFFLGRRHRNKPAVRFATMRDKMCRAGHLLDRHRVPVMLGFRFLYGLRAVLPYVIGMGPVRTPTFMFLNFVGAVIWAVAVAYGGYALGAGLEIFLGKLKKYEIWVFGGLAALGFAAWLVSNWRARRRRRLPEDQD